MKKFNSEIVWLAIAFGVMAVLFFSSSQTYAEQSQQGNLRHWLVNQPFKEFLAQFKFTYAGEVEDAAKNYFTYVEFLMRKTAHFSTYFILGLSWFIGLRRRIGNRLLAGFVAWQAATGYAGLDEFHQSLTGGRTPLIQDVALDSTGALTAIIIATIILSITKRLPQRHL